MAIRGQAVPGAVTLLRQSWMEFYLAHARAVRLTCRHFGISPATSYRWWRRYDPRRLRSRDGAH